MNTISLIFYIVVGLDITERRQLEKKESILNSLAAKPSDGGFSDIDSLTDREFEIFQLIRHGLGNRHIAEKLHVSIKTVENMREKIKTKLHMESSADLLQYAVQWMIEKG